MSRSPFPKGIAAMHAGTAFLLGLIGFWRCDLYGFTLGGWLATGLAGAAGLLLVLLLPPQVRANRLAGSGSTWLVLLPAFVFMTRLGGIPRPVTPPPLLFFSGLLLATSAIGARAIRARHREIAEVVKSAGDLGEEPGAVLAAYFEQMEPVATEGRARPRTLRRALQRARVGTSASRRRAIEAVRDQIEFVDRVLEDDREAPVVASFRPWAEENRRVTEAFRAKCMLLLQDLEAGRRVDSSARFAQTGRAAVAARRTWHYALLLLARRTKVPLPKWFCRERCELARAGFLPADLGGTEPALMSRCA